MTSIGVALKDLLDRGLPLEEAFDRHFAPTYRQRTDGQWDDREGVFEHISHLRTFVADARVTVLDELTDGASYAERHLVRITKDDGGVVEQEVYVFGVRDENGLFTRIEETTLMLQGSEQDRNVGSAKATPKR